MIRPESSFLTEPPIDALGVAPGMAGRQVRRSEVATSRRFVTQSHALGASAATPQSVFLAAVIAVAVFLIGRRLSA